MTYVRTEEIKQKQSIKMKHKHAQGSYDWQEIELKRKQTYKEKGTRPGRKPGNGPIRRGEYKPCPVCEAPVYYKPKHIKEGKRKCCSRKCLMVDPVYRQKLSSVDKSYLKTDEYRASLRKPTTREYRSYRNNVARLTERNYVEHIDVINPDRHPRTIAGVDGGYQLDHIKPVRECFDEGIAPEAAAAVQNLRMLPWRENLARNKRDNSL
jgi:hypothetical protein